MRIGGALLLFRFPRNVWGPDWAEADQLVIGASMHPHISAEPVSYQFGSIGYLQQKTPLPFHSLSVTLVCLAFCQWIALIFLSHFFEFLCHHVCLPIVSQPLSLSLLVCWSLFLCMALYINQYTFWHFRKLMMKLIFMLSSEDICCWFPFCLFFQLFFYVFFFFFY